MYTKSIRASFAAFTLLVLFASAAALAQNIYKTVDENGNVVYTDQRPSEDAEPIPLPELTVVDPVEIGDSSAVDGNSENDRNAGSNLEFTIVSPEPDEQIVNTGYTLNVQLSLNLDLPAGAEVVYILDGEEVRTTRSLSATLEEVIRGPHTIQAELRSSRGRVLASTEQVSFFMRQQSALHRRPG